MDLAGGPESGERALVSSCSIHILTCVGSLIILPVIGSRMAERFVGAVCCCCFSSFAAVLKMDLRASLGSLTNIWRSAESYLLLRILLACLMVSLVAMRCSL